jgi:NAD(P)-dependent dehydrogenase (short-subunit alcohol dehydrogenase family)
MGELLWRSPEARVILMSSGGMYTQRFDLEQLEMTAADYDGVVAYARVKRAQVLLAKAWARHFAPDGPHCCSMHPGWVDTPGVSGSLPGFSKVLGPLLRSPAQGVDTLLWLLDPSTSIDDGAFYLDRRPRPIERWPVRHASSEADPEHLLAYVESVTGFDLPVHP